MDILQKLDKKMFPYELSTLSKTINLVVQNNKSKPRLVTPTGLPRKTVECFLGFAWSWISCLSKGLFRCRAFFSIIFALRDNLLRLSSPGKLPRACVSEKHSASPECSFDLGVARKFF